MSAPPAAFRIHRILMALDATDRCVAALEETAVLAARLDAELLGLFVEDTNLLRLASLPFARETGTCSATTRRLEDIGMARALRAQAQRARSALAAVSARRQVQTQFRAARGQVVAAVLEAAQEADLVILALGRGEPIGARIRAVLSGARRSLLLLREGTGVRPPVTVIPGDDQALEVACQMARTLGEHEVTAVFPQATTGQASAVRADLIARIQGAGLTPRIRLIAPGADSLLRAVATQGCGTLVLGSGFETTIPQLLACTDCAILMAH